MKEKININDWIRRKQYTFFSKFTNPYVGCSLIVNVDNLVRYSKKNGISFYGLMMFFLLKTLNDIDEFRYVLEDDCVYKYDKINATFSVLDANNQINFSRTVEYNDMATFLKNFNIAKLEAETKVFIPYDKNQNKCYMTCTPWMRINAVQNPFNYNNIDSIPRFCWGKYFLENSQYMIDLSISVNHAFQDGYHLGLLYNTLQKYINEFGDK